MVAVLSYDVLSHNSSSQGMPSTLRTEHDQKAFYHPAPLLFWLLAVPTRATGGAGSAIAVTTAAIQVAAITCLALLVRPALAGKFVQPVEVCRRALTRRRHRHGTRSSRSAGCVQILRRPRWAETKEEIMNLKSRLSTVLLLGSAIVLGCQQIALAAPSGENTTTLHASAGSGHRPPSTPHASSRHNVESNGSGADGGSSDYMYYRGGWVQESPHLYLVLWGDWSLTNDRYNVQNRLYYFLSNVGGSKWGNVLRGYGYNCTLNYFTCPSGAVMIQNPSGQYRNYWKDTTVVPSSPTQAQMAAEAQRAAAYFGDYSHNAQYVIALPTGHRDQFSIANGFCAWHNWAPVSYGDRGVSYTALPYAPDYGTTCGNYTVTNNILDGVTLVESHEYSEAVTNPYVTSNAEGWDDSTRGSGEIGDKCNWSAGTSYRRLVTLGSYSFPVQAIWSNYNRYNYGWGCVFS